MYDGELVLISLIALFHPWYPHPPVSVLIAYIFERQVTKSVFMSTPPNVQFEGWA